MTRAIWIPYDLEDGTGEYLFFDRELTAEEIREIRIAVWKHYNLAHMTRFGKVPHDQTIS